MQQKSLHVETPKETHITSLNKIPMYVYFFMGPFKLSTLKENHVKQNYPHFNLKSVFKKSMGKRFYVSMFVTLDLLQGESFLGSKDRVWLKQAKKGCIRTFKQTHK